MSREQVENYLDIQLRDMDYLKHYSGNVRAAFLDPSGWYETGGFFEKKYEKALMESKQTLMPKQSKTKATDNPILSSLIFLYNKRLAREQYFIKEWCKHFEIKEEQRRAMLTFPKRGSYSVSTSRKYAEQFSQFIQSAIGSADDEIIATLRSDSFAEKVSGLDSAVYSSKAAKRNKASSKTQSNLNLYYENLFQTFFYGQKQGVKSGPMPISLDDMRNKGTTVGGKVFKKKFLKFIQTYYQEIAPAVEDGLDKLGDNAADLIYKNFNSDNPKAFRFTKDNSRGVSKNTEKQLKKMLLATLRAIADVNNSDYKDFSIDGLLEVNPLWEETQSGFHFNVQLQVNKIREQRSELKRMKKAGQLLNGKKINMRHYNRTYIVDHEDDNVQNAMGEAVQLKDLFLNFFYTEISNSIGRELTKEERSNLQYAIFQKVDKTIKRGDKALAIMSIFGPGQMKGFLGEIATTYALQSSDKKTYTEVTGGERASTKSGGQLHYDVAAIIHDTKIGFQVKNYNSIETKGRTLYQTDVGIGTKEMYKYFGAEQVRHYRWLFANGKFISQYDSIPDLREQMTKSFYGSISNFLRISDASIEGGIDSDIYVLGRYYLPSSYLIACAIKRVQEELQKGAEADMFSLGGDFPAYRYKLEPTTMYETRERADGTTYERVKEKHMTSGLKRNIIYIDKPSKTRVFGKGNIHFSGINIQFKI